MCKLLHFYKPSFTASCFDNIIAFLTISTNNIKETVKFISVPQLLKADTQSTSLKPTSTLFKVKGFYLCSSGIFHYGEAP